MVARQKMLRKAPRKARKARKFIIAPCIRIMPAAVGQVPDLRDGLSQERIAIIQTIRGCCWRSRGGPA